MLPWLSFWQAFFKLFFKRMDFYALGFIFIAKSAFPSVFLVHLHHRKYSNFSFSFWFSLNSRPFTQYITTSLLWKHCFTWTTPHCSVHLVFGTLISIQNCARRQHRIPWGYMWCTFLVCILQLILSPLSQDLLMPTMPGCPTSLVHTWAWAMERHGKTGNIAQHKDHVAK